MGNVDRQGGRVGVLNLRIDKEKLAAIREQKRKADEAYALAKKLAGGDIEAAQYEERKERSRKREARVSERGRDIGELPKVKDPATREECRTSFRRFCEVHFPEIFFLPWSPDHLKVVAKIEAAVLRGGLFAVAMPRGFGKTSLCQCAVLWALLYGHRRFVALIGAEAESAAETLDAIKMDLETNDRLAAQFPEVCYPIRCLEGIYQKRLLYRGKLVRMMFKATQLVLPNLPDAPSAHGIVRCAGLTGRVRGMHYQRPDGKKARPDFVLLDDPQTDESARSVSMCTQRERIIYGAVLGLAGPKRKIAGIMPCTVVRSGDLADRCLDRQVAPMWQGERTQMLYKFPTAERLWKQYEEIYSESLRNDAGATLATVFYEENRAAMDAGGEVAWPELFDDDEASGLQHAMNLKMRDEAAFWAECQNDPRSFQTGARYELTAADIAEKINRLPRGLVPVDATTLTAFVDVQQKLLYYCVAAWTSEFTGYVVDYGTYPGQRARFFTARGAEDTLQRLNPGDGIEGQIFAGLETLDRVLFEQPWRRQDGASMTIDLCLVDANWGQLTDTVYEFCRTTASRGRWMPSHGKFIGASSEPLSRWAVRPGDKVGDGWKLPNVQNRRAIRYCVYDTNHWKSFVHSRLAVARGDRGCLSLYGGDAEEHEQFAQHLTAEYRVETESRKRRVDEWKQRPARPDNHWLDCVVGAAVAASIQGCALPQRVPITSGPAEVTAEMIAAYNRRKR